MTNNKQEPKRKGATGLVFVACLLFGLAIGLLTGYVAASLIGGLGVGFIAMASMRTGEW